MPVNMASRPRARVQGIYLIPVGRARVGLGSRAFILFLWVGLSLGYGPLAWMLLLLWSSFLDRLGLRVFSSSDSEIGCSTTSS